MITMKIAKTAMVARESIGLPPCGRRGSSGRFDDENEALAVDDFDASPRLQRQASARTPNLPVDPHSSLVSVPRQRLALGAEQRSEEHTSELQSLTNLVCRLLLEKKKVSRT